MIDCDNVVGINERGQPELGSVSLHCQNCVLVSKTAEELELCLNTIVTEYENQLSALRLQLVEGTRTRALPSNAKDAKVKADLEYSLYSRIPNFKDEMRRLGDQFWKGGSSQSKDTAMLYYEAAALNGCVESCVRVAMHCLGADERPVDHQKAKVRSPQ